MNKIPIIRKGSYKDYLNNSIGGGFILGLLFFLISLPTNSVINSMWIGLSLWVGVIILFIGVGFTSEEYFKRKQKIKKLYSDKYAFLENLLIECNMLIINVPRKPKWPKETNWKQKFQKPQNENICLTYLNTEMNGNFHFLSFCAAFLKVQNQVL